MKKVSRVSRGFTLAELIMSILVISIIMVVLAPVITKRVTDNITVNILNDSNKLFLYSLDEGCTTAEDGQKSVDCIFTAPQGVRTISAVIVSGGGGGAGAANPNLTSNNIKNVTATASASSKIETIIITNTLKKAVINYMTGGGGGGGSGAYYRNNEGTLSEAECEKYNAVRIGKEHNGSSGKDLCVTKFNAGDHGGPTIGGNLGINIVNTSAGTCSAPSGCCWVGQTASICNEGNSGYSGCDRTVCNFKAAQVICSSYQPDGTTGWRLPDQTEIKGWSPDYKIYEDIYLCSNTPREILYCMGSNNCMGAGTSYSPNQCSPNAFWGSAQDTGKLSANALSYIRNMNSQEAQSVRCVYEKPQSFEGNAGGGGGSSPVIKNYIIPENILTENVGGKIVIKSGAGGQGGAKVTIFNTNGKAGKEGKTSEVSVYDSSNTLKWGLRVYGGNGAKITEFTEDPEPNGADAKALQSCEFYDGANWTSINCTLAGNAGERGQTYKEAGDEPEGGTGGDCKYDGNGINGGAGGISMNPDGGVGSGYGAGGGGGAVYTYFDDSSGTNKAVAKAGKGGSGGNGVVNITLTEVTQAAGGGAGGGGAFAKILDLEVVPGQQYPVRVGGGGIGGADNTPGENGGQSWIKIGGTTYAIGGGEGGKIGTPQAGATPAVHGLGGAGGSVPSNTSSASDDYYNGGNGTAGDDIADESTGEIIGSSGGCGGESGIGSTGATGGMNICAEGASINGINATSLNFISPGNALDQAQYGTAGSGGGGGGWDKRGNIYSQLGDGSSGLDGYVYIFWTSGN